MNKDYIYFIDSPKKDNTQDISRLYIQGWIVSNHPVKKVFINDEANTNIIMHSRPDVEKVYPNRPAIGFKYLLYAKDIIKLPNDLEVRFVIDDKIHNIVIDQGILNRAKVLAAIEMESYEKVKYDKLQKIKPYLICPICHSDIEDLGKEYFCHHCKMSFPYTDNSYDFLTPELRKQFSIVETDNVSSNCYGGVLDQIINDLKDRLILDCGAGCRDRHLANVINYEIVDYPSTDVLGVGERLPFRDNTFDAILSLAVLEHVIDPFTCASEMIRVLKPGGKLMCQVPFLQPYHGYPNHYYNMTEQGLINLFNGLKVETCTVPLNGHPVFTLSWFLNIWCSGLQENDKKYFMNMQVKDLLDAGERYLDKPFAKNLSPSCQKDIASVNFLIATKP